MAPPTPLPAGVPPREAIDFFRAKGFKLGFAWQDVWQEEHAQAFTVAKAMRVDLLQDIRAALDRAIAQGTTFEQFKAELVPTLKAKGWWGRQDVADPLTGKLVSAQLGSPRRLATIFDVNVRSAYAAGRWEQIQRVKAQRPFLRYVAVLDRRTRPMHRHWHGTLLPVDDAWWGAHYPPNGWRCRCTVQQLSERDLKRRGLEISPRPNDGTRKWINRRTGELTDVPAGIDPGFGFNIGAARLAPFAPRQRAPLLAAAAPIPPAAAPPPLLAPRPEPASRILPEGEAPEYYVDRFLAEFGASRQKPAVHIDPTDEPLVIGDALFRAADGALKLNKGHRAVQVLLLADAIRDPDEIWLSFEELRRAPGEYALRRRYIARRIVEGEGESRELLTVFEIGRDGWQGVSAFGADSAQERRRLAYIEGQRRGVLLYRRKD